jgi:hypothetical protein
MLSDRLKWQAGGLQANHNNNMGSAGRDTAPVIASLSFETPC